MPSEVENLKAYRESLIAELADRTIKPSYSIDGQAVDWNAYRAHLLQMIAQVNQAIIMLEPFEIRSQAV